MSFVSVIDVQQRNFQRNTVCVHFEEEGGMKIFLVFLLFPILVFCIITYNPEQLQYSITNSVHVDGNITVSSSAKVVDKLSVGDIEDVGLAINSLKTSVEQTPEASPTRNYYPLRYAQALQLTLTDSDLYGLFGGIVCGQYAYIVPGFTTVYHGKIARVDLNDFSTVTVLDIGPIDPLAAGFVSGFTDGYYVYFVPNNNANPNSHGKFVRVDVNDFSATGVTILDLTATNSNLKGYYGGFAHGKFGYLVPNYNTVPNYSGYLTRVDLSDFSTVDFIDLSTIDSALKGFADGFTDGKYGYLVPLSNSVAFGKVVRFDLSDFSASGVTVLDLTLKDPDLKGFYSGFVNGKYGYFVPFTNGENFGKFVRVDLTDFTLDSVSVLDLTLTSSLLKGFMGGFCDGRYAYLVPSNNGAVSGVVPRIDLYDFETVEYVDMSLKDPDLEGFWGGFTDGRFGYFVPQGGGKLARIQMF